MGYSPAEAPQGFLATFSLFVARFCTSAWIGAATLFVIVGVTEITRGGFDTVTKDMLVSVRFPAYYLSGATLICCGWLGGFFAGHSTAFPRSRRISVLILLTLVLGIMAVDYVLIYLTLLRMVVPPGQAKPSSFIQYHEASKWINLAGLTLCLAAATLLQWPTSPRSEPEQVSRGDVDAR